MWSLKLINRSILGDFTNNFEVKSPLVLIQFNTNIAKHTNNPQTNFSDDDDPGEFWGLRKMR